MSSAAQPSKSHHLPNGRFTNPWTSFKAHGLTDFVDVLWNWDRKGSKVPPKDQMTVKVVDIDFARLKNPNPSLIQATWLGHASQLIQMEGINIICDPVFQKRCSPFTFAGPARYTPPACTLERLLSEIKIDVMILSHNHYDHCEVESVKTLGPDVHYFVPLKMKSWFTSFNYPHVTELDWWDTHTHKLADGREIEFVCTPAQHFSGRGLHDRMSTLWASWAFLGKKHGKRFFFSGDTGYRSINKEGTSSSTCPAFKEIGEKYGPFDLAAVPIGAYSPRSFMSPVHCDPEDAVEVHKDIKAKSSFSIHWGAFPLTDEPINEPPERLKKALAAAGLRQDEFVSLNIGETITSETHKS
ncbi:hypothetical protein HKX48_006501 [Thoreauomyces humboldtii]|nr:hypothetical protein HKX48_006501 [Thoreauomyces humboldtii]